MCQPIVTKTKPKMYCHKIAVNRIVNMGLQIKEQNFKQARFQWLMQLNHSIPPVLEPNKEGDLHFHFIYTLGHLTITTHCLIKKYVFCNNPTANFKPNSKSDSLQK